MFKSSYYNYLALDLMTHHMWNVKHAAYQCISILNIHFYVLVCLLYCGSTWRDRDRLNESQTVFCESRGVSRVDEQYPGPLGPWLLSASQLHDLLFSQHHSVITLLMPVPHYDSCPFIKHGPFRWMKPE